MKLSIIIPCFNAEKHILRCLKSIINQGLSPLDYEIVIIDDGSKDKTSEVIENFKKPHKNILLYKQENFGQGVARNKGVELAKGDFIYFIDSDDYLAFNSINIILNQAISNKLDVIGFNTLVTDKIDLFNVNESLDINQTPIIKGVDYILNNKNHRLEAWWYLINREYLIKVGCEFDEGTFLEDVIFTFKILYNASRFTFLPITIHRYLQHPNSTMQSAAFHHLNKLIDGYVSLIFRLNNLKGEKFENEVIKNIEYLSNTNTFYLFFKITKSNLSIKKIDEILIQLKKIKAYPFDRALVTKEYNHYKIKAAALLFNNKVLFYLLLYPIRLLYKINFIRVP